MKRSPSLRWQSFASALAAATVAAGIFYAGPATAQESDRTPLRL